MAASLFHPLALFLSSSWAQAATSSSSSQPNSTNVLLNADFENDVSDVLPWICSPNDDYNCGVDLAAQGPTDFHLPQSGQQNAYIRQAASIAQNVLLEAGTTYNLRWWMYMVDQVPTAGNVQLGFGQGGALHWGDPGVVTVTAPNGTQPSGPYAYYSLNLTAPASSGFLTLLFDPTTPTPNALRLDNFTLEQIDTAVGGNFASSSSSSSGSSGGHSTGALVGAVVGTAAGTALLGLLGMWAIWRQHQSSTRGDRSSGPKSASAASNPFSASHEVMGITGTRDGSTPGHYYGNSSYGGHGTTTSGSPRPELQAEPSQGPAMPGWGQQQAGGSEELRMYARSPDVYPTFSGGRSNRS